MTLATLGRRRRGILKPTVIAMVISTCASSGRGKLCDSSQRQCVHLQRDQSHFRGFLGGYDNMMHAKCLA